MGSDSCCPSVINASARERHAICAKPDSIRVSSVRHIGFGAVLPKGTKKPYGKHAVNGMVRDEAEIFETGPSLCAQR